MIEYRFVKRKREEKHMDICLKDTFLSWKSIPIAIYLLNLISTTMLQ